MTMCCIVKFILNNFKESNRLFAMRIVIYTRSIQIKNLTIQDLF